MTLLRREGEYDTERMLSPHEVAEHVGLGYRAVLNAIESGELPAARLRGRLRVSRYDMLGWIKDNQVHARQPRTRRHKPTVKRFTVGSLRDLSKTQEAMNELRARCPQERAGLEGQVER